MNMKSKFWRRTALILVSIPVVFLTWMNEVANVTWGWLRDYPKAFKACWRGY